MKLQYLIRDLLYRQAVMINWLLINKGNIMSYGVNRRKTIHDNRRLAKRGFYCLQDDLSLTEASATWEKQTGL